MTLEWNREIDLLRSKHSFCWTLIPDSSVVQVSPGSPPSTFRVHAGSFHVRNVGGLVTHGIWIITHNAWVTTNGMHRIAGGVVTHGIDREIVSHGIGVVTLGMISQVVWIATLGIWIATRGIWVASWVGWIAIRGIWIATWRVWKEPGGAG